jgi:hypothetical protein
VLASEVTKVCTTEPQNAYSRGRLLLTAPALELQ